MQENLAYLEDERDEQTEFVIEDPRAANWAVMRVKEERARRDLFIDAAQAQIEHLNQQIQDKQQKCDQSTAYWLFKLDEYLNTAPAKRAKTQVSLDLPAGKLVRKLPRQEYIRDNELLAEILAGTDYVDTKPVLRWAELKKDIDIVNGAVVLKTTGEVLEGIAVEEKPAAFDIK